MYHAFGRFTKDFYLQERFVKRNNVDISGETKLCALYSAVYG